MLSWLGFERQGRVEERKVRLGLRTLDAAEVLEGLAAGDIVLLGTTPAPGQRVQADLNSPAAVAAARTGSAARQRSREDAGSAMTNAMGR